MRLSANFQSIDSDEGAEVGIPVRGFTVQEYHRLAEVGILTEADRVELLEGVISPKMVHSPIHDATVSIIECLLRTYLATGYLLRIQSAITLHTSEPEPDLALVVGPPTRYLNSHPMEGDIAHVVEIAETSIQRDRLKAAGYASVGIPVYWIVNLKQQCIEVFESPAGGSYTIKRRMEMNDHLELPVGYRESETIQVADCLPPQ